MKSTGNKKAQNFGRSGFFEMTSLITEEIKL